MADKLVTLTKQPLADYGIAGKAGAIILRV
jgi:hypothetical protein